MSSTLRSSIGRSVVLLEHDRAIDGLELGRVETFEFCESGTDTRSASADGFAWIVLRRLASLNTPRSRIRICCAARGDGLVSSRCRRKAWTSSVVKVSRRSAWISVNHLPPRRTSASSRTTLVRGVSFPNHGKNSALATLRASRSVPYSRRFSTSSYSSHASTVSWRRAALAIDEYRHDHGWVSPYEGSVPNRPTISPLAELTSGRSRQSSASPSNVPAAGANHPNDDGHSELEQGV
jgi:hypothetical protein